MNEMQLREYIDALSKAHASGHKCDKELKTAIELYTAEIGIKDLEKQIEEKVRIAAEEKSKRIVRDFVHSYYDFMKSTMSLVNPAELYNAFKKYVEEKVS